MPRKPRTIPGEIVEGDFVWIGRNWTTTWEVKLFFTKHDLQGNPQQWAHCVSGQSGRRQPFPVSSLKRWKKETP